MFEGQNNNETAGRLTGLVSGIRERFIPKFDRGRRDFIRNTLVTIAFLKIPKNLRPNEISTDQENPAINVLRPIEPIMVYNFPAFFGETGLNLDHVIDSYENAVQSVGFVSSPHPHLANQITSETSSAFGAAVDTLKAYININNALSASPNADLSQDENFRFLLNLFDQQTGEYNLPISLIPPDIQAESGDPTATINIDSIANLTPEERSLALFAQELITFIIALSRFKNNQFDQLGTTTDPAELNGGAYAQTIPNAFGTQPDIVMESSPDRLKEGGYSNSLVHELFHLLTLSDGDGPLAGSQTLRELLTVHTQFLNIFYQLKKSIDDVSLEFASKLLENEEITFETDPKDSTQNLINMVLHYRQRSDSQSFYAKVAEALNANLIDPQSPYLIEFNNAKSELGWLPPPMPPGYFSQNANQFEQAQFKVGLYMMSKHGTDPEFLNILRKHIPGVNFAYNLDHYIARHHYQFDELMAFIAADVVTNGHFMKVSPEDPNYVQYTALTQTMLSLGRQPGLTVEAVQAKIRELGLKYQIPHTLDSKPGSSSLESLVVKGGLLSAAALITAIFATRRKAPQPTST